MNNVPASKAPAFQFYPDDFIGGTVDMTDAEVGQYVRLLCHQWGRGKLPEDRDTIDRVAGGKVSDKVIAKFPRGRNRRLEMERKKQAQHRMERAASGRLGASKRWHGTANGYAIKEPLAKGMAKNGSPSPSPSPSPDLHEREYTERPSLEEVLMHASRIGLAAWKAEDFFSEMESCGWLDFNHRPVQKWQPMLNRVRTKWESDGRPKSPPIPFRNGHASSSTPITTYKDGTPLLKIKEL